MNDLLRSLVFFAGIATGTLTGVLAFGRSQDHGETISSGVTTENPDNPAVVGRKDGHSGFLAQRQPKGGRAPELHLANVLEDFAGRAATLKPGQAEGLLREFAKLAGVYQLAALVDIAARQDPLGCLRALRQLERSGEQVAAARKALFHQWMITDPGAALDAILKLPGCDERRGMFHVGTAALAAADPIRSERFLAERQKDIALANLDQPEYPRARAVERPLEVPRDSFAVTPELGQLQSGSPEALRYVAGALPGTVTPQDFLHAIGHEKPGRETLEWLATQPGAAPREALIRLAWRCREFISDPDILAAALRRAAVEAAESPVRLKEFAETLSSEESPIALDAIRMETALTPLRQQQATEILSVESR